MDVATGEIKLPSANTDIMGYCDAQFWISDYTFKGIFDYRASHPEATRVPPTPSLIVWGHIENGEPVLEPAFRVTTRPLLPRAAGPYTVQGLDEAGQPVFSLSFGAEPNSDVPGDWRHFAFAVPVNADEAARIATLRLTTRSREVRMRASIHSAAPSVGSGIRAIIQPPAAAVEQAGSDRVRVRWDATTYPLVVVRDPQTGAILSLARGGTATVYTGNPDVDLLFSDGVHTVGSRELTP
jgi:hypothetical protein